MKHTQVSIIIPTHNRAAKLAALLNCLRQQDLAANAYEIIVVDDGSTPPVMLPADAATPPCRLVRLEGVERSAARNAGAAAAQGELLIFLDDDMAVGRDFLTVHLQAQREWPGALAVGAVNLPAEVVAQPFGNFRQKLERREVPSRRGLTAQPNFCTAQNMSLPRQLYQQLGGFDPGIVSSEDQDLALRHTARGGRIVFLPEAAAIHHDSAFDIRSYCRRAQWGMEQMIPFCQRYPEWPENVERERINGVVRWARGSTAADVRKMMKATLALKPVTEMLFMLAAWLERWAPNSRVLDRIYRLLLGAHIWRGYRRGWQRYGAVTQINSSSPGQTTRTPREQQA